MSFRRKGGRDVCVSFLSIDNLAKGQYSKEKVNVKTAPPHSLSAWEEEETGWIDFH